MTADTPLPVSGERIIVFDTEFYENGRLILPISIGMVADDGTSYYAEWEEAAVRSVATDWLRENVHPHLRGVPRAAKKIAADIVDFAGPNPTFWAYYADYDWVLLCQLYGRMIDLPDGWPMYCRDIKQEADRYGVDLSDIRQEAEHDALADAMWGRKALDGIEAL